MNYNEVYDTYSKLKDILILKKQAIIKKNLDELNRTDEMTIELSEKIKKFDLKNIQNEFTDEQKKNLKALGQEIKKIQEDNEILIKHSLSVINNILSGILNIVQQENSSYNSKGESCTNSESLDISSITEEA